MFETIVAGGIDDNYVYPYIISIISAQKNSRTPINFALAYDGRYLSIESKEFIEKIAKHFELSLSLIEIELPEYLPANGHISPMAFSRLIVADSLDQNFVWLDADTLSVGPIDELLSHHFLGDGSVIAARKDIQDKVVRTKNHAKKVAGMNYFNSGVVVINPVIWREKEYPAHWKTAVKNYQKYHFDWSDQCVLNFLTKGNYRPLPTKFNVLVSKERLTTEDSILHFAGATKPWNAKIISIDVAREILSEPFLRYLELEVAIFDLLGADPELKNQLQFHRLGNRSNRKTPKPNSNAGVAEIAINMLRETYKRLRMLKRAVSRFTRPFVVRSDFKNLESRRWQLSIALARQLDFKVRYGLFEGMVLEENLNWSNSDLAPMLLGTYELPILEYIQSLSKTFNNFINLGAGDGYYVTGMVKSGVAGKAFAYEMNEVSRDNILKQAILNEASENIVIRGIANSDFINEFSDTQLSESLILIDVEGAEFEIFENIDINRLVNSHLIIEIHEFVQDIEIKLPNLIAQLQDSHEISVLSTGARNLDSFIELKYLNDSDRWLLASEGSPMIMKWLCCRPR